MQYARPPGTTVQVNPAEAPQLEPACLGAGRNTHPRNDVCYKRLVVPRRLRTAVTCNCAGFVVTVQPTLRDWANASAPETAAHAEGGSAGGRGLQQARSQLISRTAMTPLGHDYLGAHPRATLAPAGSARLGRG